MNTSPERREGGLPILRQTGCRIGQHVFVWTGVTHTTTKLPPDHLPCQCGLLTYAEVSA